jgi:hypothetical protein
MDEQLYLSICWQEKSWKGRMEEDWAQRVQKAWPNRMIELEAVILQVSETLIL